MLLVAIIVLDVRILFKKKKKSSDDLLFFLSKNVFFLYIIVAHKDGVTGIAFDNEHHIYSSGEWLLRLDKNFVCVCVSLCESY